MATLADISAHVFGGNRRDGFRSLGITLSMMQGKMNREGKENYGVVVRNMDVEICPVGAIAFYLLELWMVCVTPSFYFLFLLCPRVFTSLHVYSGLVLTTFRCLTS